MLRLYGEWGGPGAVLAKSEAGFPRDQCTDPKKANKRLKVLETDIEFFAASPPMRPSGPGSLYDDEIGSLLSRC